MLRPESLRTLPKQYIDARKQRHDWGGWFNLIWFVPLVIVFSIMIWISPEVLYFFGPIAIFFLLVTRGKKIVLKRALVRQRGGVCPCCWRQSGDPKPGCPGCQPPAGRAAHRVYWRIFRVSVPLAEQWFSDRFLADGVKPPVTRVIVSFLIALFLVPVAIISTLMVATLYFNDLSWMGEGYMHWIYLIGFPAGWVSVYFAKRRAGNTRHCAKCEYQLAPVGERPDSCPECGNNLKLAGQVVIGRTVGTRWPMAIILSVFVAVFLVFPMVGIFDRSQLSTTRLVPTQTIVHHVLTSKDPDWDVWRALESRSLTDQQIEDLLREMQARLSQQPGQDADDRIWCLRVGEYIAAEAGQRKLPHAIELQMLRLAAQHRYDCSIEITQWVDDAIARGDFSQSEIQAAGMQP